MNKFEAQIDFKNKILRIGHTEIELLPLSNKITIPKRSEIFLQVYTDSTEDGICEAKEIQKGIFLSNCVTSPKNGKCIVSLVNSNEKDIEIITPVVKLEKFEDIEVAASSVAIPDTEENRYRADRLQELRTLLRTDHLNNEEKDNICNICDEFNDLFHLPNDKLSATNATTFTIPLMENTTPMKVKPYRLPHSQNEEINKQLVKMEKDGIIQKSNSPWNFPLLVVPKKLDASGQRRWRICVDYRKLNERSIASFYQLPNITDILDKLGKSKYFTVLDLALGFHQIPIDPADREKIAFSAPYGGSFEYLRVSVARWMD